MVVCTLCSCYPWEVLGLPPVWYKSAPYRSRAVKDPRGVLADFGVKLPKETEIRVWDSTAETRFLVLPMRPARHRRLERGAARRSRHPRFDDRHGPRPHARGGRAMNGIHDMGGMDGFGKVEAEPNEPPFHERWEGRVLAMQRAMGYAGAWHIDDSRYRPGDAAAARLSRRLLLLALGAGDAEEPAGARVRDAPTRSKPAMRCSRPSRCRASSRRRRAGGHDARLVLPPAAGARALQAGRPRAHEEHPSADPHPAAALCARQARHGRADPRLPRLSRCGRDRPRRRSAVALYGGVRRPRDLGRGCRSRP